MLFRSRPADYSDAAERGIYEGSIGFGLPYDWAGDRVKRRKVYGTKPKEKPESNEPGTGDTYKGSKQGGTGVKRVKPVRESQIDEISAELVGKVSNARFWQGKAPSKTLSRAIAKKFIAAGKELPEQPPFTGSHKRSHEKSSTHVRRLAIQAMEKQKSKLKEETMDNKDQIQEAIHNIQAENLNEMKENFLAVLQEKAMDKLEERKKEIAANYFAQ